MDDKRKPLLNLPPRRGEDEVGQRWHRLIPKNPNRKRIKLRNIKTNIRRYELEGKIQLKNTQLQGATEKLEEYSQRYNDLVLPHNKDIKKKLTRANRILRRLERAAKKTGNKQKDDPIDRIASKRNGAGCRSRGSQ
jgi:hypothetical protein